MTPTLLGRIQTRLLLFLFVGLPITAVFSLLWFEELDARPFGVLVLILLIGLALDPLWIFVQRLRWDRDFPFAFQALAMWLEFGIALSLISLDVVPLLSEVDALPDEEAVWGTVIHFTLVFIASFLALLGLLQIFLVRWRYKGGELGRFDPGAV